MFNDKNHSKSQRRLFLAPGRDISVITAKLAFSETQINRAALPCTYCLYLHLSQTIKIFMSKICFVLQPVNNADFIIPVEIDGTVHQVMAASLLSRRLHPEAASLTMWPPDHSACGFKLPSVDGAKVTFFKKLEVGRFGGR